MAEWKEWEHPRDGDGKFTDKDSRAAGKEIGDQLKAQAERIARAAPELKDLPESYRLPDEIFPRSIGAKWSNYDILMPDGSHAKFEEGTKLQDKEVIAGKGCRRKIDDEARLLRTYGGTRGQWMKCKGKATIVIQGKPSFEEVHWYEYPEIGKFEFKIGVKS